VQVLRDLHSLPVLDQLALLFLGQGQRIGGIDARQQAEQLEDVGGLRLVAGLARAVPGAVGQEHDVGHEVPPA
jgi:hypothetical protein